MGSSSTTGDIWTSDAAILRIPIPPVIMFRLKEVENAILPEAKKGFVKMQIVVKDDLMDDEIF